MVAVRYRSITGALLLQHFPTGLDSGRKQQACAGRHTLQRKSQNSVEHHSLCDMGECVGIEEELRVVLAPDIAGPDAGRTAGSPELPAHGEFGGGGEQHQH